jgi:hypothetical protein
MSSTTVDLPNRQVQLTMSVGMLYGIHIFFAIIQVSYTLATASRMTWECQRIKERGLQSSFSYMGLIKSGAVGCEQRGNDDASVLGVLVL